MSWRILKCGEPKQLTRIGFRLAKSKLLPKATIGEKIHTVNIFLERFAQICSVFASTTFVRRALREICSNCEAKEAML